MLLSSFALLNENKLIMYFKFENPRILSSHSSTEIPKSSNAITLIRRKMAYNSNTVVNSSLFFFFNIIEHKQLII